MSSIMRTKRECKNCAFIKTRIAAAAAVACHSQSKGAQTSKLLLLVSSRGGRTTLLLFTGYKPPPEHTPTQKPLKNRKKRENPEISSCAREFIIAEGHRPSHKRQEEKGENYPLNVFKRILHKVFNDSITT